MCMVCMAPFGHLDGCPEAPGPRIIGECGCCGGEISEWDEPMELDGMYICEECLDNMSARDLVEALGGSKYVA